MNVTVKISALAEVDPVASMNEIKRLFAKKSVGYENARIEGHEWVYDRERARMYGVSVRTVLRKATDEEIMRWHAVERVTRMVSCF